jgi:hypothetical protein
MLTTTPDSFVMQAEAAEDQRQGILGKSSDYVQNLSCGFLIPIFPVLNSYLRPNIGARSERSVEEDSVGEERDGALC